MATPEILLVEDDPGDTRLTREALRDGKVENTLNLPRKTGREVIAEIESDPGPRLTRPVRLPN